MISHLSSSLRRTLVASRIAAMTRGPEDARRALQHARATVSSPYDKVAISLAECDLLASDLQPTAALELFEREIGPLLKDLDSRTATVISDNKTQLLMASRGGVGEFYHLVDARRILGVEIRNHAAKLEAASQAAAGKHYDALPTYWQQLRRAYELQNWRARNVAEADFCNECVQLGLFDEAAFHAMVSETKVAAEQIGDVLLACRVPKRIGDALNKLLGTSCLRVHARQTALVLAKCGDAVPDELLARVSVFLTQHASFVPTGWHDLGLFENVWGAIKGLARRLSDATVRGLLESGLKNSALQVGGPARKHLIDALNALTSRAQVDQLPAIAEVALGLVTDRRSDIDYTEALNLLCHAADRGGESLKSQARAKLFPPGAEVRDALLMQVGPSLGWQPSLPESVTNAALQTAEALRKQVERLAPGDEPAKLGGLGTFSSSGHAGRIVVHVQGAMRHVHALAVHRRSISDEGMRSLVSAMLEMTAEPENLVSNRASLVIALEEFLDRLPAELEQRTVEVLEPLAAGNIAEPSQGQSHADATNPLNPIKMGGGDPIDLQGAALKLLCKLDRSRPAICPALHASLLLAAVTNANVEVRRYGLFAAAHGANLTSIEKSAIALAGLDADPRVARLAIPAMIESGGLATLDPLTWQIIIRVVESAVHSPDGSLRANASRLLKELPSWPTEVAARFEVAKEALASDALFSVRQPLR